MNKRVDIFSQVILLATILYWVVKFANYATFSKGHLVCMHIVGDKFEIVFVCMCVPGPAGGG